MKSIFQFFVLLAVPGSLAKVSILPLGKVVRCPYSKEGFLDRVTLDGLKDYITENKMATSACVKEIGEDYEEALKIFVTNMTKVTEDLKKKSSTDEELGKNYAYFVSKAVQEMGTHAQRYVQLLKQASDGGKIESANRYDETLKEQVEKEYDLYEKNLGYLKSKGCNSDGIQNLIHKNCGDGMRMLVGVKKDFKDCMNRRLTETKEYLQS